MIKDRHMTWDRLVEPLRRRGILVRHTSGPFHWYPDGGASARQGRLWFIFGRAAGTAHLQCWVADRDEDSNATICTLANLLVAIGRGSQQALISGAARRSDCDMMEAYADVIVESFGRSADELDKWRETVKLEEDMAPHVERMFETK